MISEADILMLHELSIADYGGAYEIRDRNLLLSAIARPFQTFDGKELYLTPIEKAAAIGESLIINHPFVDGNKRTAFLAMIALLNESRIEFLADAKEIYSFVMGMSTGENNFEAIVIWLKTHTK